MLKAPSGLTGVMICMPCFGQQNFAHTTLSLFNTAQVLTLNKIPNQFRWQSSAEIEDLRNLFLTFWYDGHPGISHLLMVDADMGWAPKLIMEMIAFDKDVTGCFYARRQWPAVAVGRVEGDRPHTLKDVTSGFIKVDGVGGGVLMIKRSAIARMLKKMPQLADEDIAGHPATESIKSYRGKRIIRAFDKMDAVIDGKRKRLSEDLAFCERIKQSGGEVWANVDHLISHVGPFDYAIRYADFLEQKAAETKPAEAAA